MRRSLILSASLVAATLALTACSSEASNPPATLTPPAATVTATQTVTDTATPRATPTSSETPAAVTAASTTPTAPSADSFVMPNEVGQGLQAAQDDIQRVSGNPLFFTDSTDASGAGRLQILDRDWKVCSQNVAPGARVNQDSDISFAAVKLGEACP